MSIFDAHSEEASARSEGLWQEPGQAQAAGPASAPRRPATVTPLPSAAWHPSVAPDWHPSAARHPSRVEVRTSGDPAWAERLDDALSSGISSDTQRLAQLDAEHVRQRAAFDSWRARCAAELLPVLERSAEMLRAWGLDAGVTEVLTDQPCRLPRRLDVALRIARFGDRGPGKLTLSATESSDVVRVTLKLGPACIGGEPDERVGMTTTRDLSGELVGGLVATLVEQLFG